MDSTGHQPPFAPPRESARQSQALLELQAQVEALAHELEVLRHAHHDLNTYHHHLRFRLAEKANLCLKRLPAMHRLLRAAILATQSIGRRLRRD